LAFPLINSFNTLKVGISWSDIFQGYLNIGISMLIDWIFSKAGGGMGKNVGQHIGKQVFDELNPISKENLLKVGLKAGAEFVVSYLFDDNPTGKVELGSPYLKGSIEWSKSDGLKGSLNILPYKGELSSEGIKNSLGGTDIE